MPIMPDLANKLTTVQGIASSAPTASTNGTGVSFADHEVGLSVVCNVGAVTGTTPTCTVALEQSSNDNTADASGAADAYSAITGASTALTDSDANSIVKFMCYNHNEKYIRVALTIGGTNPTFNLGVTVSANKKS